MRLPTALRALLRERVAHLNEVTDIQVDASAITVSIMPPLHREAKDGNGVSSWRVVLKESWHILVQGLGLQGQAVRYDIALPQFAYLQRTGEPLVFTVPIVGIHTNWLVTDEVLAKARSLQADGHSAGEIARLLKNWDAIEVDTCTVQQWLGEQLPQIPIPRSRSLVVPT